MKLLLLLFCLLAIRSPVKTSDTQNEGTIRYILYDVNPGEGFNLRRDVFVRMAVFVKKLNEKSKGQNFKLVLPPWGRMYHWQTAGLDQERLKWGRFFDVDSISRYVPSLELEDFIQEFGSPTIDQVFYLQNYAEGWESGNFEFKYDFRECIDKPIRYWKDEEYSGLYKGRFWGYGDTMAAKKFDCLSVQGSTDILNKMILEEEAKDLRAIFLDRAESLLHERFGDHEYWSARRSARFTGNLVRIADDFRLKTFNSTDNEDNTVLAENWMDHKPKVSPDRGGNYACVHLRRKDYVWAREGQIPDIPNAAAQIRRKMEKLKLSKLFLATDAPDSEIQELETHLNQGQGQEKIIELSTFRPSDKKLLDGESAIVDQSICSHAKYFLGSPESTFTFRIQEEREIMGFREESTFEMLCPNGRFDCKKESSHWRKPSPTV